MTGLLAIAAALALAARAARLFARAARRPPLGEHEWEEFGRWSLAVEYTLKVRCLRCGVTSPAKTARRLPRSCAETKDYLVVEKVMES